MPKITLFSPAKVNLHLQIGGLRADGFHDINSLFLAISFGDTLSIETAPKPLSLDISMNLPLAPENNIITRAVTLFRERTGYDEGLKVAVEKRIPLGGGLGGGSSNAASALVALNRLAAAPLSGSELAEIGAVLGSDVPFFIDVLAQNTAAAWVSGRGEQVRPFEAPEQAKGLTFLLLNSAPPSSTAEAYKKLDLYREKNNAWKHESAEDAKEKEKFFFTHPREWRFFNDFLPVLSVYQPAVDRLKELGADFAGLSGSGSACFGVFSGKKAAKTAQNVLKEQFHGQFPFVKECVINC